MNNQPNIKAPSISATTEDGVQWTYDPTACKWVAIADGKKFSSKDFDTVSGKVDLHMALGATKDAPTKKAQEVAAPELIEIGLLAVKSSDRGMGIGLFDPLATGLKMEPVIVKVEWDKSKNDLKIVRYKETEQKDSGWKSWRADDMLLVHPRFMTGEMRKVIEKSFEGQALRRAFSNANEAIAQAWWGVKVENRTRWALGRHGFESEQRTTYDRHSGKTGFVAQSWPITIPADPSEMVFDDWKPQDDGSLSKGGIVVRMERREGTYHSKGLVFNVYLPNKDAPVFSSGNLRTSLLIGNASVQMTGDWVEEPISTWMGTDEWEKDPKQHSWPTKMEVHAAAIIPKSDPYRSSTTAESYFYGRIAGGAMSDGDNLQKRSSSQDDNSVVGWHMVPNSWAGSSFRATGPEDIALVQARELKVKFRDIANKSELLPISTQAMSEIFEGTLTDIYNAIMDGEEIDKDPAAAKAVMGNLMRSIEQSVISKDRVKNWEQVCNEAVVAGMTALESTSTKPKSRKPR